MSEKVRTALRSHRSLIILAAMCLVSYAIAWWISVSSQDPSTSHPPDNRGRRSPPAEPPHRTEKHSPQLSLLQIQDEPAEAQGEVSNTSRGTTSRAASVARFVAATLVVPRRAIGEQRFTWILPQGVRLANTSLTPGEAQIEGRIPPLQAGQSWPLRIEVEWDLDSNGKDMRAMELPVVLHVYREINGQAVGQLSQFDLPISSSERDPAGADRTDTRRPQDSRRDGLSR
jgi:hypothetical protein